MTATDKLMSNPVIVRGSRVYVTTALMSNDKKASVMAIVDGYAMVRYPRCTPFVAKVKDLAL